MHYIVTLDLYSLYFKHELTLFQIILQTNRLQFVPSNKKALQL